jgi:hypothetical protein
MHRALRSTRTPGPAFRRVAAACLVAAAVLYPQAADATQRSTRIAMAVALLDLAEEHCGGAIAVDPKLRAQLLVDFHEYDIAGLASVISRELNAFYEDFLHEMKRDRAAFCRSSPAYARAAGYPLIKAVK